MSDKYILEGHKIVACDNLFEWAQWFENADRRVAETILGDVRISTVFLGLNHSFGSVLNHNRVPLVFETMIFGGILNLEMERYPTWQDAEEGHKRWVAKAQSSTSVTPDK